MPPGIGYGPEAMAMLQQLYGQGSTGGGIGGGVPSSGGAFMQPGGLGVGGRFEGGQDPPPMRVMPMDARFDPATGIAGGRRLNPATGEYDFSWMDQGPDQTSMRAQPLNDRSAALMARLGAMGGSVYYGGRPAGPAQPPPGPPLPPPDPSGNVPLGTPGLRESRDAWVGGQMDRFANRPRFAGKSPEAISHMIASGAAPGLASRFQQELGQKQMGKVTSGSRTPPRPRQPMKKVTSEPVPQPAPKREPPKKVSGGGPSGRAARRRQVGKRLQNLTA